MPVTIKSTALKFRDPSTGGYVGVDMIAEATVAEQQAAIEEKGEEVIASIPSDYTTLSGKVTTLESTVVLASVAETKQFLGIS